MSTDSNSDLDLSAWDEVRERLEAQRRPIQDEIRRYPPPIPACDAHFNHLLDRRSLLSRELVRFDAARAEAEQKGTSVSALEAFVRTSPCLDEDEIAEPV